MLVYLSVYLRALLVTVPDATVWQQRLQRWRHGGEHLLAVSALQDVCAAYMLANKGMAITPVFHRPESHSNQYMCVLSSLAAHRQVGVSEIRPCVNK